MWQISPKAKSICHVSLTDILCSARLCVWTVNVPPGFGVLLEFHHLDLEKETDCRHDRLTVSAGSRMVVGKHTHTHTRGSKAYQQKNVKTFPGKSPIVCPPLFTSIKNRL